MRGGITIAQKRMFDKTITNSDKFLEMPDSTQNLYFHLNMEADDDGFVDNWKSIMRMTGKKEDDLKLLVAKSFIIPFESGIIVIKHWRINNYLRKDRYNITKYIDEKNQLSIKENGEYILENEVLGIPVVDTEKNRIEENSIEKNNIYTQMFEEFYSEYPKKKEKSKVQEWFLKKKPKQELFEEILSALKKQKQSKDWTKNNGQYIPYPRTWLNNKRWEDETEKTVDEIWDEIRKEEEENNE